MFGKKKQYYRRLKYPPWVLTIREACAQFAFPLLIFQFIRTLFFPTALDVIVLLIFAALTLSLIVEWI